MSQPQVIEGTREELMAYIGALPDNGRFRLLVVPKEIDQDALDDQEQLRRIGHELFAQADAVDRHPGKLLSNPEEAQVAEMIKAKYRRMGLQV